MEKDNLEKVKLLNEKLASWLLFFCAAAVMVSLIVFSFKSCQQPTVKTMAVKVVVDTTGVVTPDAKMLIDSVQAIVASHEHLMNDHYQYLIEQKESTQEYLTIGGIFITVILSLFGFFGYKSFHSVEEHSEKIAEEKAENVAKNKATEIAESIAKEKAEKTAEKEISRLNTTLSNDLDTKIKSIKEEAIPEIVKATMTEQYEGKIEDKMASITNNAGSIESIEKEIASLKRDIEEIRNSAVFKRPSSKNKPSVPGMSSEELAKAISDRDNEPKSDPLF